ASWSPPTTRTASPRGCATSSQGGSSPAGSAPRLGTTCASGSRPSAWCGTSTRSTASCSPTSDQNRLDRGSSGAALADDRAQRLEQLDLRLPADGLADPVDARHAGQHVLEARPLPPLGRRVGGTGART